MARSDWKRPTDFSAPEGRRRVAVKVAYDGRAFCGWQSQEDEKSVQDKILKAAKQLTGQENIEVCGSGRTDSKVHARGQVAHIEMDNFTIDVKAFHFGLNSFLPPEIRILDSWDVDNSFHARYSAMAREYRYFIKEQGDKDTFTEGLVTRLNKLPDIDLLNSYASLIVGTHDFTTFTSSKDVCPSKVRDIYESEFFYTTSMYGEKVLCYKICGNAFLYHMVRSLVGTMVTFALKNANSDEFKQLLDNPDRSLPNYTAPSDGLYLWRVSYDENEYQWFEEKYGN